MRDDSAPILDDILCRWYAWQRAYTGARGFNARTLVAGDFRVSRQYDDVNGSLDHEIENDTMKTVEFVISEMPDLQRWTIQFLARALALGYAVFVSPRLPADKEERDHLVQISRIALIERLIRAGVM